MRKTSLPLVRQAALYLPDAPAGQAGIPLGSPAWTEWLARLRAFIYESQAGHFSARRETRRGKDYWYAYRRREGRLYHVYLGRSEDLDAGRLEQACAALAGEPGRAGPG
ncbi:MAG: hypothetical protein VB089_05645, partial [Anaerolineaceae bacterium]|nr:hypothetical protein [Anaerolineaceae bacterium]